MPGKREKKLPPRLKDYAFDDSAKKCESKLSYTVAGVF